MTAAVALRRPPPDPRLLQRCLLLAVLLHIWLVLVFGNASGTAAPGQGVWGSLTVKLLGRSGSNTGAPPSDKADAGSQAQAAAEPGAARLGRSSPQEVPPEAARAEEAPPAPPSTATLELPEGFKPVERETLTTPPRTTPPQTPAAELPPPVSRLEARPEAAVTPLPSAANLRTPDRQPELPSLPTELPAPVRRLDATPAAPTAALPRPAALRAQPAAPVAAPSVDLPAAVRRLEAPADASVGSPLQRPAELRTPPKLPATAAAPSAELPAPVRRLEAPADAANSSATLPRAAELRTAAPSAALPATPSAALPSAVQRLEAPTASGGSVTPLTRSSELRSPSAAATANASALNPQDLPTQVRRLESTDGGTAVTPLQPSATPRAAVAPGAQPLNELSGAMPGEVSAPAGPAKGDPNANPYAAPKAAAGSPDAGSRLGPDLPVPPTEAASAPRAPLNLSLPRGDIAARRSPGLVDMLPQPPERKSKLEQSIEDAANKDCRKAYANTGILAAIPLALDAARGKGCKW
ncbi:Meckel syndrome type 1 protein [Pelomonas saccharophila]|uniref:Meckel syndrome type 1 protein n=1 Tax=Roseateles saccharophilus TaxID=304 RepID=A0ABU1YSY1_ROSSA|nr:hypothetical protein [Roseateles saccharophilus]MDR7271965.1 Meckel syndrome type 1 protein [Roseateles saccharophilus]